MAVGDREVVDGIHNFSVTHSHPTDYNGSSNSADFSPLVASTRHATPLSCRVPRGSGTHLLNADKIIPEAIRRRRRRLLLLLFRKGVQ